MTRTFSSVAKFREKKHSAEEDPMKPMIQPYVRGVCEKLEEACEPLRGEDHLQTPEDTEAQTDASK